jgi:hypothetical protein
VEDSVDIFGHLSNIENGENDNNGDNYNGDNDIDNDEIESDELYVENRNEIGDNNTITYLKSKSIYDDDDSYNVDNVYDNYHDNEIFNKFLANIGKDINNEKDINEITQIEENSGRNRVKEFKQINDYSGIITPLVISPRSGGTPGSPPFLFNPPGNIIPLEDFPCTRLYSSENKDIDPSIFDVWNMDLKPEYVGTGDLKYGYAGMGDPNTDQLGPLEGLNPFNNTSYPTNRTFAGDLLDSFDDTSPTPNKNSSQNIDSNLHYKNSLTLEQHFEFRNPLLENPFDLIDSQHASILNQNPFPLTPLSLLIPPPLSATSVSPTTSPSTLPPYSPLHSPLIHDNTRPPSTLPPYSPPHSPFIHDKTPSALPPYPPLHDPLIHDKKRPPSTLPPYSPLHSPVIHDRTRPHDPLPPYSPLHTPPIHDNTRPHNSKDIPSKNDSSPYNSSEDLHSFLDTPYGNTYNTYNKLEIPYMDYNSANVSNSVFYAHFNDDNSNNDEYLYELKDKNKFVNNNTIASNEEKGDDDDDEIPSLQHMNNPSIEVDSTPYNNPPKTVDRPRNTGTFLYLCVFICNCIELFLYVSTYMCMCESVSLDTYMYRTNIFYLDTIILYLFAHKPLINLISI